MNDLIQTLDLGSYVNDSASRRRNFVYDLRMAFSDTGFFFLKNHLIADSLVKNYSRVSQLFFQMPEKTKKLYEYKNLDHQVGWTPLGLEKGEYAKEPDLKEFFQVGDSYPYPYIREIDDFAFIAQQLFTAFRMVYRTLLCAVAESLELDPDYFIAKEGNSIMRSILYPATPNPPQDDEEVEAKGGNALGMCSSRHTDINMLTLLFARKPGLQLKYKREYVPVTVPDPNMIIVNVGDMLEHLTGGKYKSGFHRVVCEPNIERWSVPFFGHVLPETSIVPIISSRNLEKYKHNTAKEYLDDRLKKIGLTAQ